jgi:branched-chain amino acid transport system permease protein
MKSSLRSFLPWFIALLVVWVISNPIHDFMDPYFFTILMYAGINCILAVSLNLISGFTGQFSMGHAGFMSVGGYVSAFITTTLAVTHPELTQSPAMASLVFLIAMLSGGLVAAAIGYLVGLPSLRLKGDYLAIVTLGFGEIIRVIVLNISAIGGARGMPNIPQFASFSWVYSWVILTIFFIWRLVHSPQGRKFMAVREDEIAAEAMGVNTTQAKVRSFVIGSFFAGIAGALFAHYLSYLNPQTFDFNRSFEIIIMVVLGGMGSITGSVVAAIFLTVLREALRPLQELTRLDFRMVIYALLLIILMLTRPNGLFGTREIKDFFNKRRKS